MQLNLKSQNFTTVTLMWMLSFPCFHLLVCLLCEKCWDLGKGKRRHLYALCKKIKNGGVDRLSDHRSLLQKKWKIKQGWGDFSVAVVVGGFEF